ncbi:MAG: hypothetical protein WD772_08415 [Pseudohongiellaceae bacterium]
MKKHGLFLAIAAASVMPTLIHAAEVVSPNPELDQLIGSQQFQQAYELGLENLEDWEGDNTFDFYFGIAALEAGFANEAVFALERVAATTTDATLRSRARLELARAYFLTNSLAASENLFNLVLSSNPPENVRQNIEAFLQLIELRQQRQTPNFVVSVSSSFGNDDNVNAATANGLIDAPLIGEIELSQDGQQTEDTFSNSTFDVLYRVPLTSSSALNAALNINHLNNIDTDKFDLDILRGEIYYDWGSDKNRFRHGVNYTLVNLDQNGYQQSPGINSSWQRTGSNGWYQTVSGSYSPVRYDDTSDSPQNSLRDVNQYLIGAGLTKLTQSVTYSINFYYADEDPGTSGSGKHNGRHFSGIAYSMLYRFNNENTPYLRLSYQDVEHDDYHPVYFEDIRQDDTTLVSIGWLWQINKSFSLNTEASFTKNDSNIELFEYDRFKYFLGFRYQF